MMRLAERPLRKAQQANARRTARPAEGEAPRAEVPSLAAD
jgi:hypothetical protein